MRGPMDTLLRFLTRRELQRVRVRSGCVAEIEESHEDGFHHPVLSAHPHDVEPESRPSEGIADGDGAAVEPQPS